MHKKRLNEFSVMRAFAIFTILFHHLASYSFNYYNLNYLGLDYDLSFINDLNRYFGLSIFVYISGYLQNYSYTGFSRWRDVGSFLIKKAVRIYPIYWVALFIFIGTIASTDLKGLIIHLIGLQILLAPALCDPIITLWYVGLIMLFYVVFVILKKYGKTPRRALIVVVAIPIVAMALTLGLHVVEKRFFVYYPVFVLGIYSPKLFNLEHMKHKITIFASAVLAITAYLYVSYVYPHIINEATRPPLFSLTGFEALAYVIIIMVCSAWIAHHLSLKIKILPRFFEVISYASYGMYLLHRPLWWGMQQLYNPADGMLRGLYLSAAGIPTLIFLSFLIQAGYDKFSSYAARTSSKAS